MTQTPPVPAPAAPSPRVIEPFYLILGAIALAAAAFLGFYEYTPMTLGVYTRAEVTDVQNNLAEKDPQDILFIPKYQVFYEYQDRATGKTYKGRNEPSDDVRLKAIQPGDFITIQYYPNQHPGLSEIVLDYYFWHRLAGAGVLVLVAFFLLYLGLFSRMPEPEPEFPSEEGEPQPEAAPAGAEAPPAPEPAPAGIVAGPLPQAAPSPIVPGPPVTESEHGTSAS